MEAPLQRIRSLAELKTARQLCADVHRPCYESGPLHKKRQCVCFTPRRTQCRSRLLGNECWRRRKDTAINQSRESFRGDEARYSTPRCSFKPKGSPGRFGVLQSGVVRAKLFSCSLRSYKEYRCENKDGLGLTVRWS